MLRRKKKICSKAVIVQMNRTIFFHIEKSDTPLIPWDEGGVCLPKNIFSNVSVGLKILNGIGERYHGRNF